MTCCEVLFQVRCRRVQLTDPLVGVLLRELRVESIADGQDMGDTLSTQNVFVLSCDMISQEEALDDFIHGLYASLFSTRHLHLLFIESPVHCFLSYSSLPVCVFVMLCVFVLRS